MGSFNLPPNLIRLHVRFTMHHTNCSRHKTKKRKSKEQGFMFYVLFCSFFAMMLNDFVGYFFVFGFCFLVRSVFGATCACLVGGTTRSPIETRNESLKDLSVHGTT